ncbi:MAG: LiaI-LiaF-like domain-containing protein [Thermoanaerobaculia bacterium]
MNAEERSEARAEERSEAARRQGIVGRIVFGVLFIGIGALFTLDNIGIVEAGRLRWYWPVLLVGSGIPPLVAPKTAGDSVWGMFLVALGAFFLLRRFDVIDWSMRDVWPLFLVLAGAMLLLRAFVERRGPRNGGVQPLENGGAR